MSRKGSILINGKILGLVSIVVILGLGITLSIGDDLEIDVNVVHEKFKQGDFQGSVIELKKIKNLSDNYRLLNDFDRHNVIGYVYHLYFYSEDYEFLKNEFNELCAKPLETYSYCNFSEYFLNDRIEVDIPSAGFKVNGGTIISSRTGEHRSRVVQGVFDNGDRPIVVDTGSQISSFDVDEYSDMNLVEQGRLEYNGYKNATVIDAYYNNYINFKIGNASFSNLRLHANRANFVKDIVGLDVISRFSTLCLGREYTYINVIPELCDNQGYIAELWFEYGNLLTKVLVNGESLVFMIDTGAPDTFLYKKEGFSGDNIEFSLGGRTGLLHVESGLESRKEYISGVLGVDFFRAHEYIIFDFNNMKLRF